MRKDECFRQTIPFINNLDQIFCCLTTKPQNFSTFHHIDEHQVTAFPFTILNAPVMSIHGQISENYFTRKYSYAHNICAFNKIDI